MSLFFVEVVPLLLCHGHGASSVNDGSIHLSAPFVKHCLRKWSLEATLGVGAKTQSIKLHFLRSDSTSQDFPRGFLTRSVGAAVDGPILPTYAFMCGSCQVVPIIHLPSDDPYQLGDVPCFVIGFTSSHVHRGNFLVSEDTLIRVAPAEAACIVKDPIAFSPAETLIRMPASSNEFFSGVINVDQDCPSPLEEEVLRNHDNETIEALRMRMSLLLSREIHVGTTANSFELRRERIRQSKQMNRYLRAYPQKLACRQKEKGTVMSSYQRCIPPFALEGSLVLYSSHHGAGKTLLVKAIARRFLACSAIKVIQPGLFLAKYGIHADAALESVLHNLVVSVAAHKGRNASICIILDQLDVFLPPELSGKEGKGDAAQPVLNGIAAYLRGLSLSLKTKDEFPFPTKNPVYSLGGKKGVTAPLKVCLVGIVTCPDDVGSSNQSIVSSSVGGRTSVVNALAGGRFRLQDPSTRTRISAYLGAFQQNNVELDEQASKILPLLASSAFFARGSAFQEAARTLKQLVEGKRSGSQKKASVSDLQTAIAPVQRSSALTSLSPLPISGATYYGAENDLFKSVGGNMDAKRAIEDALALDPLRRQRLSQLGFSAPSGVLLYGPPGTGKTKLAKAVANKLRILEETSEIGYGGGFISLRATDIVRSEVGKGEKMVVEAFETARSNSPAVVFIDEFQALFTERSRSGSGRLTSTLLQCMDDIAQWREADRSAAMSAKASDGTKWNENTESNVVVIAATNTPWMVDRAFLRPGRFDQVVHVGLPALEDRESILSIYVRNMRLSHGTRTDKLCKSVAKEIKGFSGADIVALCRAAAIRCLDEQGEGGRVDERHFLLARKHDVTFSTDKDLEQQLLRWRP